MLFASTIPPLFVYAFWKMPRQSHMPLGEPIDFVAIVFASLSGIPISWILRRVFGWTDKRSLSGGRVERGFIEGDGRSE